MPEELNHINLSTNGINIHAVEAGPSDGPLLILLHGFPEFWYGWRKQINHFAGSGYHVVVPDQRGYNLSDKPKGVSAYGLDDLSADVAGIIDHFGSEKAYLAGHDWGGVAAWWTAVKYPEKLEKLAILNVPHPVVMRKHIKTSKAQRKKSWYVFFFQIPRLPENRMQKNNWEIGRRALQGTSRKGAFTDEDVAEYRKAWSQPGAGTAMINWYRASLRKPPKKVDSIKIKMPTLLIWGKKDRFLGSEMAQPSIDLCNDGTLVFIDEATHWVQHEEPERVNQLLQNFFQPGQTSGD